MLDRMHAADDRDAVEERQSTGRAQQSRRGGLWSRGDRRGAESLPPHDGKNCRNADELRLLGTLLTEQIL